MHLGLVSGLTWSEMQDMGPGVIMDMFIWRRTYDDEQHRIRRE